MVERTKCGMSRVWFYHLVMVTFVVVVGLISSANILQAQELSEEMMMTAMVQYTLKYRFGKDLKVGDFVKYQCGEDEFELKVTKQEKGGVWIVDELDGGMKIHMLVDLKRMQLIECFGFDDEGEKRVASLLSDKELAQIIEMGKKEMEKEMEGSEIIGWKKGEGEEKVEVPAGSFTCSYLEPEYSEQYKKRIEDYIKLLQEHGKSDAEIDAEISKNEPGFTLVKRYQSCYLSLPFRSFLCHQMLSRK